MVDPRSTPRSGMRVAAGFGLVAALSTSFGQTYFIGLFGSELRLQARISVGEFGALYGLATLAAGLVMFWAGGWLDRIGERAWAATSCLLLALGCGWLPWAQQMGSMVLALFLLRLAGPGLLSHVGVVVAARHAADRRGFVLAITGAGFTMGAAVAPWGVGRLRDAGWEWIWVGAAAATLLVALPCLLALLAGIPHSRPVSRSGGSVAPSVVLTRAQLLRDRRFLAVLAVAIAPGAIATAVLLHQSTLALARGWDRQSLASAVLILALLQFAATFVAGALIDRLSARRLLPFALIPLSIALLASELLAGIPALWALYAGMGVSVGVGSVLVNAIWVELYGLTHHATVRGMASAGIVVSASASPLLFGLGLETASAISTVIGTCVAYTVAAPLLAYTILRDYPRDAGAA